MKFEAAILELRKGKKITSSEMTLKLHKLGELQVHSNIINSHHIMNLVVNDDWEVLEEPGKTFPEVFDAFKKYKKIRRKCWDDNNFMEKEERLIDLNENDLLANDWEVIDD